MSFFEKQPIKLDESTLPVPTSAQPTPNSGRRRRILTHIIGFLALLGIYHLLLPSREGTPATSELSLDKGDGFISKPVGTEAHACSQASIVQVPKGQENRGDVFYSPEFGKREVEQFLGALRIRTESFDDMANGDVDTDPRYDAYFEFHEYLLRTYPKLFVSSPLLISRPWLMWLWLFIGTKSPSWRSPASSTSFTRSRARRVGSSR